ncbi:MAG: hypothetical protein R3C56_14385 [Pirellulaceae bacterium]
MGSIIRQALAARTMATHPPPPALSTLFGTSSVATIEEHPSARWYPVIDFSCCTNCMECIDFCLFGVYGIDTLETIVVEQADNCRKGCPACSRVCPQNAIIFPHKTPAIAGAPVDVGGLRSICQNRLVHPTMGRMQRQPPFASGMSNCCWQEGAVGKSTGISERLLNPADGSRVADQLDVLIDRSMHPICRQPGFLLAC